MAEGGHVWQRGSCVAGGIAGEHGRGCAWQGVCMAGGVHGRGACVAGGAWQGVCMAGGMHAMHTPLSDTTATAYGQ